jgi:hypothetical protein
MLAQIRLFVVVLAALGLAARGGAQAPAPAKAKKDSTDTKAFIKVHEAEKPYTAIPLAEAAKTSPMTQADAEEKFVEIEKRWMVDSYLKNGEPRNAKLDDRVVAFLTKAASQSVMVGLNVPPRELGQEGLKILEDGCKDPLVTWVAFQMAKASGVHDPKLADMEMILEVLEKSKHTPAKIAMCAYWLTSAYTNAGMKADRLRTYHVFRDELERAIANPSMDPMEQRYLVVKLGVLMDELELGEGREITEMVLGTKGSPQWLRLMFGGLYHAKLVSIVRMATVGAKNRVDPSVYKTMEEHLDIAQKSLEKAHELCPQHPDAACEMIRIALYGGHQPGHGPRYWFDQACKAQIDEQHSYNNYLQSLRPYWKGSIESMRAFAEECLTVRRADALTESFVAQVEETICDDAEDHGVWMRDPQLVATVVGVLERVIANPKHASRADMYRTELATVAMLSGKWDVGRRALDGMKQPIIRLFTDLYRVTPEDVEFAILARTEPATKDLVLAADQKMAAKNGAGAVEDLRKALAAAAGNERLAKAMKDVFEQGRVRAGLMGTDWVDVCGAGEHGAAGWRVRDGAWTGHPTGFQMIKPGRGLLSLEVPVGKRFELEASILFAPGAQDWLPSAATKAPIASDQKVTTLGSAGLVFGLGWERTTLGEWIGVMVEPSTKKATMGYRGEAANSMAVDIGIDGPVRLRVVRFDTWMQVQVNGKTTYSGRVPEDKEWRLGSCVGLMTNSTNAFPAAGFRDIRVRRLEKTPGESKTAGVAAP